MNTSFYFLNTFRTHRMSLNIDNVESAKECAEKEYIKRLKIAIGYSVDF